eukprot:COSAG02_NODE_977_length_15502_cov_235.762838_9_plen_79_part_00
MSIANCYGKFVRFIVAATKITQYRVRYRCSSSLRRRSPCYLLANVPEPIGSTFQPAGFQGVLAFSTLCFTLHNLIMHD